MKKIVIFSVLAAVCLAMTAGAALANYGNNNKLFGYVKETGTLIPIKKAKVKLYTTGGKKKDSDTTSLKGKYAFDKLSEKKYVVRATVVGFHDPKNIKKNTISAKVEVDGSKRKNFYFAKDVL